MREGEMEKEERRISAEEGRFIQIPKTKGGEIKKMKKTLIIGILALFAVLAISTAAADSEFYLVPRDSAVPAYCNTTEVQVWINATEPILGGLVKILYTDCCANLTSYSPNETMFEDQMAVTVPGRLSFDFSHWVGISPTNRPAGVYHLGNFTIHCCNESSNCKTDLLFVKCELYNTAGGKPHFVTTNGTFSCVGKNQPPVSNPNGPYTGTEGVAVSFDGNGSYDPDGTNICYDWNFGDGNTSSEESPTHTYAQNGTYTVSLTVTDDDGATGTNTTMATVDDTEPTANFSATPTSGLEPLSVEFTDASTSYDGITSWEWDFGDGTANSTDQNPTHVYTSEGTYNVSLTVYESDGDSDTETKENCVTVTTVEPIYNVSITSAPTEQTTAPDVNANYTLTITNNGNVEDTIELNITVNEANYSSLSADNFSLNASETATAYLYVKNPDAGTYNTTVRATSQGNVSVFDVATVETNVTTVGGAPTADVLEVENASGLSGTYVVVPVNVQNVRNGPVQGIRLTVDYRESVLTLTNISRGDLTTSWTGLNLSGDRHTMIIVTDDSGDVISDGSSGTIVLLNFSVIGSPGDTSPMNLSLIELSDPDGIVGIAPAKNGTFTVSNLGTIAGRITYACNGTEIAGVVVNLTKEGIVVDTTVTNETGYYLFTDVNPDCYFVNTVKPRFYDNSTEVTVTAGATTIVDMMLRLKGDLNNDGDIANAGDVVLMLRASVGDIPGDERYDLNGNGVIADAGDIVLLLRASMGDIILW